MNRINERKRIHELTASAQPPTTYDTSRIQELEKSRPIRFNDIYTELYAPLAPVWILSIISFVCLFYAITILDKQPDLKVSAVLGVGLGSIFSVAFSMWRVGVFDAQINAVSEWVKFGDEEEAEESPPVRVEVRSQDGRTIKYGNFDISQFKEARLTEADWTKLARVLYENEYKYTRVIFEQAGVFTNVTKRYRPIEGEFVRLGMIDKENANEFNQTGIAFFKQFYPPAPPAYRGTTVQTGQTTTTTTANHQGEWSE
jgi:hypothetical protein